MQLSCPACQSQSFTPWALRTLQLISRLPPTTSPHLLQQDKHICHPILRELGGEEGGRREPPHADNQRHGLDLGCEERTASLLQLAEQGPQGAQAVGEEKLAREKR